MSPLVQKLGQLRLKNIQIGSGLPDQEELWVKQQLTDKVIVAMLEVRGTTAAINREICEANELAAYLSARRDKKIFLNSLANLVSGGVGEVAGGAFELGQTRRSENVGDLLEMLGGAMQSGLGTLALRQQRGERRTFASDPNM
ncbi:MAG: hypothetical protein HY711_07385, partial [Candidatus Melainabacteria bacterium]|nr:hypothetical protein [Candidatus Melainabacteria bacterium]